MGLTGGDIGSPPRLTYLSMDPLSSTVGSSQVLAYVERLARRGLGVDLVTFEHSVDLGLFEKLSVLGVDWRPQNFGRPGPVGGLGRVVRAAGVIRGAELVHARSDLAAASVMLARVPYWVWDVRSLWVDQKIASGVVQSGSVQEKIMRWIERQAASRSTAVLTLTASAIRVLDELYSRQVSPKGHVVTTCTDLDRFSASPVPPTPLRVLIAGTLNRYYDVPAMLDLVAELRRRRPVTLIVASPGVTDWEKQLAAVEVNRVSAASKEMKDLVSSCHVGLSICRDDAGISLLAAMPTKIGEFLASGRPVVVNPGLVEAAELAQRHRCGIVFGSSVPQTLVETVNELEAFLMDPRLPDRCRALAEGHFDLDRGVDQLVEVYRSIHPRWGS